MKRSMVFEGVAVTLLILLTFLTLAMVMGGSPESKVSDTGGYTYTYAGPDNVLYVFSTGHIQAIDASGGQAWDFSVPDGWEVCYKWLPVQISDDGRYTITDMGPIASSYNGTLYVYLKPDQAVSSPGVLSGALLAISGDGRKLWELPMESYAASPKWAPNDSALYGDTTIKASRDRVYVFHDFNETVISNDGTILWNVENVSDPAVVDEEGFVYCVRSAGLPALGPEYAYVDRDPSGVIDAYYPDGTLYWERHVDGPLVRQPTIGSPLWFEPINPSDQPYKQQWVSKNGTVFYLTPDGKVGVIGIGAVAGLTLTALYIFYHFFGVGTVARARSRPNKNENRNRLFDFIVKNPGSTLYEISRGTGLNLGTVKYHAFILRLNHKIVSSRMDGKYVRYFTDSSSYTKDEQLILSLMRRDTIGKVLSLILKKPGISNIEIARELDIRESVVCRCVKELSEKGVIAKEPAGRGCSVEESQREHVVAAMRRIYGE